MAEDRVRDRCMARLHPAIKDELQASGAHPELAKLRDRLFSQNDDQKFLDTCAEVMLARHLRHGGCSICVEVPNEEGRGADLVARNASMTFAVHIKRLNTDQAMQKQLNISERLRDLEKIARSVYVSVSLDHDLTDVEMQRFVAEVKPFVADADIGDTKIVCDGTGEELGECTIVGSWNGGHIGIVRQLAVRFGDERLRIKKLLKRAYDQFAPNLINVIMVTGCWDHDVEDFERALRGTTFEERDGIGPGSRVIRSGRDSNGFWSDGRFSASLAAGWFSFSPIRDEYSARLWLREEPGLSASNARELTRLLATSAN